MAGGAQTTRAAASPAVAIVARSASGSFRDALGTLDQLVAFNGPEVSLKSVLEMLGAVDTDLLFETVDAVAAEDAAAALRVVEKMSVAGRDPTQFTRDLLEHLRGLLILQTTGELPDSLVVAAEDAGRLSSQAATIGGANLVRLIDELAEALAAIRSGDEARMVVEVALLKAARPDFDPSTSGLVRRLERHLAGKVPPPGSPSPPISAGAGPPSAGTDVPTVKPASSPSPRSTGEDPPATAESQATVTPVDPADELRGDSEAAGGLDLADHTEVGSGASAARETDAGEAVELEEITRLWPAILDHLTSSGQSLLSALFDGTRPLAVDRSEATLEIGFPPSAAFNLRQVEDPERRQSLTTAFETVLGEKLRPVFTLMETAPEPLEQESAEVIDEDEMVQRLMTEFNAKEVT